MYGFGYPIDKLKATIRERRIAPLLVQIISDNITRAEASDVTLRDIEAFWEKARTPTTYLII